MGAPCQGAALLPVSSFLERGGQRVAQGRGPLGPSRALRDAVVPRPGVTLQPSEAGGDSSSKREGSEAGGGGFGAGMLAGLRAAAPLLPSLPPSCRSRVLAAVIPCSGLKISPGAAAAHRHLEVVINNPGGGRSRWPRVAPALPRCCRRRSEPPSSPCRWRGGWTEGGVRGNGDGAASAPWPRGETEAQVGLCWGGGG